MEDLRDFIVQLNQHSGAYGNDAKLLEAVIAKQVASSEDAYQLRRATARKTKTMVTMFDDFHVKDIAIQLCMLNSKIFVTIHPIEFLNKIWGKSGVADNSASPNLDYFSSRFELESYWAATEVLFTVDLKKRAKKLQKFIELALVIVEPWFGSITEVLRIDSFAAQQLF